MYYDDQARRFNFVSGLAVGAVLGTGLALLLRPTRSVSPARRIGAGSARLRSAAADGWDDLRSRVADSVKTGRKKIGR
jgi:gas vesicle protein